MIYIYIMGGLGNQLFQIFTGIAYALTNKIPFKIFYDKPDINKRQNYWESFLNGLKNFTIMSKDVKNILRYNEPFFHYNEIPKINNFMLYGYFQSYKYFEHYYKDIIKFLRLEKQKEDIKNKIEYLKNGKKKVSLHFRLGDYQQLQEYYPILNIQYYINSLYTLKQKVKEEFEVIYFYENNDFKIVLQSIKILKEKFQEINFIDKNDICKEEINDWEEMLIMSICNHNIVANSSFSWWSAYFNNNEGKIVCYPDIWFGEKLKDKNTKDLCPENWYKIKNNL